MNKETQLLYIILNFPYDKIDETSGAFSTLKHVLLDKLEMCIVW